MTGTEAARYRPGVIVIESPRSRRQVAAEAALRALAGAGVQLSAGADVLARQLPASGAAGSGRFAGSRVAPSGLQLALQAPGSVIATADDDVRAINDRHSAQELASSDVVVFQDYALSSARISDRPLQFTTAALRKLAALAEAGRTVCFNHDVNEVIGSTFAGDVAEATVRDVEATWLRLRWYGVLTDQTGPERRQRLQDCRTGALRYGSVHVVGGAWDFVEVEGPEGPEYFYLIDDADDLNLYEYSRCFIGASRGAGDHKFSAHSGRNAGAKGAPASTPKTARKGADLCVL